MGFKEVFLLVSFCTLITHLKKRIHSIYGQRFFSFMSFVSDLALPGYEKIKSFKEKKLLD